MKRIIIISVWSLLIVGLIVSLGFIDHKEEQMPLKGLAVTISQDDEMFFIDKMDIEEIIHNRGDAIVNQPAYTFNAPALEQVLNTHPAVANAEVYITINGEVQIDIMQRKPIVRIINKYQDGYYIDNTGRLMPLSDKYTARVLVVNGNIDESYSKYYPYNLKEINADSIMKKETWLDEIYDIAEFIEADTFWKAQIEQVYINNNNEIELIPSVGNHRILLGDASDISDKFHKLLIFYLKGLNTTGWWNNYSVINLKYRNQIVCTKKELRPLVEEKPILELAIADTISTKVKQNTISEVVVKKKNKKKTETKRKIKPINSNIH